MHRQHQPPHLSVGYNGTPSALNDDFFPWGTSDDPLQDKHNYVVHAEANAVLNYRGSLKDLEGSTVYVTLFRATTAPRSWRRRAWARSSTWTISMPTPMTVVSAAAFSIPAASATARLSSMSRLVPGDRLSSSACQRQLAAKQPKEPRPKLTTRESRVCAHGRLVSGYMAVVT